MPAFNLKQILAVDAVTCLAVFGAGVCATAAVAPLLGLPKAIVAAGGWICLAAALLMLLTVARKVPSRALVNLIALGNFGWVAASLAVVGTYSVQMTTVGIVGVSAMALGVLVFAIIEAVGAKALAGLQLATN